eukprot:3383774-Amphidinium_carterae.2
MGSAEAVPKGLSKGCDILGKFHVKRNLPRVEERNDTLQILSKEIPIVIVILAKTSRNCIRLFVQQHYFRRNQNQKL